MNLIRLPVYFVKKEISDNMANDLLENGAEFESIMDEDYIYLNPEQVASVNISEDGRGTVIRMSSNNAWFTIMKIDKVLEMLK
jgi:hypothetical protein